MVWGPDPTVVHLSPAWEHDGGRDQRPERPWPGFLRKFSHIWHDVEPGGPAAAVSRVALPVQPEQDLVSDGATVLRHIMGVRS